MFQTIANNRFASLRRIVSGVLGVVFVLGSLTPPAVAAPGRSEILPPVGALVRATAAFRPATMLGLTVRPENPLQLDFIIDSGESGLNGAALASESAKLINYFLTALTLPEDQLWVNLSPYEQDRIIPDSLSRTEMGRDMLAQDYLLKQLTASLMYPEDELGRRFWDRIIRESQRRYGTTELPANTFNKIWIIPEFADVFARDGSVFVVDSHLSVMLEEDYLAREGHSAERPGDETEMDEGTKELIREILIPEIEREINEGENFAQLRQIFNSMILAVWYKKNLKDSLLGQLYADQNLVKGVDHVDPQTKRAIYDRYIAAFRKGVFNYVREDVDPVTQAAIPRKYFSGGVAGIDQAQIAEVSAAPAQLLARAATSYQVRTDLTALRPADAAILADRDGEPDWKMSERELEDLLADDSVPLQVKFWHALEFMDQVRHWVTEENFVDSDTLEVYRRALKLVEPPRQYDDRGLLRAEARGGLLNDLYLRQLEVLAEMADQTRRLLQMEPDIMLEDLETRILRAHQRSAILTTTQYVSVKTKLLKLLSDQNRVQHIYDRILRNYPVREYERAARAVQLWEKLVDADRELVNYLIVLDDNTMPSGVDGMALIPEAQTLVVSEEAFMGAVRSRSRIEIGHILTEKQTAAVTDALTARRSIDLERARERLVGLRERMRPIFAELFGDAAPAPRFAYFRPSPTALMVEMDTESLQAIRRAGEDQILQKVEATDREQEIRLDEAGTARFQQLQALLRRYPDYIAIRYHDELIAYLTGGLLRTKDVDGLIDYYRRSYQNALYTLIDETVSDPNLRTALIREAMDVFSSLNPYWQRVEAAIRGNKALIDRLVDKKASLIISRVTGGIPHWEESTDEVHRLLLEHRAYREASHELRAIVQFIPPEKMHRLAALEERLDDEIRLRKSATPLFVGLIGSTSQKRSAGTSKSAGYASSRNGLPLIVLGMGQSQWVREHEGQHVVNSGYTLHTASGLKTPGRFSTLWNRALKGETVIDQAMTAASVQEVLDGYLPEGRNPERTVVGPFQIVHAPWRTSPDKPDNFFAHVVMPFDESKFFFGTPSDPKSVDWRFDESTVFWEGEINGTELAFIEQRWPYATDHFMIVPQRAAHRPQVLQQQDVELMLSVARSTPLPGFRLAFNSLKAGASINHLHLHGLTVPDDTTALEQADLVPVARVQDVTISRVDGYGAPGLFFAGDDPAAAAREAYAYIHRLQLRDVAHAAIATPRGLYVMPVHGNIITSYGMTWSFYELLGFIVNADTQRDLSWVREEHILREMAEVVLTAEEFRATYRDVWPGDALVEPDGAVLAQTPAFGQQVDIVVRPDGMRIDGRVLKNALPDIRHDLKHIAFAQITGRSSVLDHLTYGAYSTRAWDDFTFREGIHDGNMEEIFVRAMEVYLDSGEEADTAERQAAIENDIGRTLSGLPEGWDVSLEEGSQFLQAVATYRALDRQLEASGEVRYTHRYAPRFLKPKADSAMTSEEHREQRDNVARIYDAMANNFDISVGQPLFKDSARVASMAGMFPEGPDGRRRAVETDIYSVALMQLPQAMRDWLRDVLVADWLSIFDEAGEDIDHYVPERDTYHVSVSVVQDVAARPKDAVGVLGRPDERLSGTQRERITADLRRIIASKSGVTLTPVGARVGPDGTLIFVFEYDPALYEIRAEAVDAVRAQHAAFTGRPKPMVHITLSRTLTNPQVTPQLKAKWDTFAERYRSVAAVDMGLDAPVKVTELEFSHEQRWMHSQIGATEVMPMQGTDKAILNVRAEVESALREAIGFAGLPESAYSPDLTDAFLKALRLGDEVTEAQVRDWLREVIEGSPLELDNWRPLVNRFLNNVKPWRRGFAGRLTAQLDEQFPTYVKHSPRKEFVLLLADATTDRRVLNSRSIARIGNAVTWISNHSDEFLETFRSSPPSILALADREYRLFKDQYAGNERFRRTALEALSKRVNPALSSIPGPAIKSDKLIFLSEAQTQFQHIPELIVVLLKEVVGQEAGMRALLSLIEESKLDTRAPEFAAQLRLIGENQFKTAAFEADPHRRAQRGAELAREFLTQYRHGQFVNIDEVMDRFGLERSLAEDIVTEYGFRHEFETFYRLPFPDEAMMGDAKKSSLEATEIGEDTPIERIDLSPHSQRILLARDIRTYGQLRELHRSRKLDTIPGMKSPFSKVRMEIDSLMLDMILAKTTPDQAVLTATPVRQIGDYLKERRLARGLSHHQMNQRGLGQASRIERGMIPEIRTILKYARVLEFSREEKDTALEILARQKYPDPRESLGSLLGYHRIRQGLTVRQMIDVHQFAGFEKYESDKVIPELHVIKRLVGALGLSETDHDWLMVERAKRKYPERLTKLADYIAYWRNRRGLTQDDVIEQGISRIRVYETGDQIPRPETVARLDDILGWTPIVARQLRHRAWWHKDMPVSTPDGPGMVVEVRDGQGYGEGLHVHLETGFTVTYLGPSLQRIVPREGSAADSAVFGSVPSADGTGRLDLDAFVLAVGEIYKDHLQAAWSGELRLYMPMSEQRRDIQDFLVLDPRDNSRWIYMGAKTAADADSTEAYLLRIKNVSRDKIRFDRIMIQRVTGFVPSEILIEEEYGIPGSTDVLLRQAERYMQHMRPVMMDALAGGHVAPGSVLGAMHNNAAEDMIFVAVPHLDPDMPPSAFDGMYVQMRESERYYVPMHAAGDTGPHVLVRLPRSIKMTRADLDRLAGIMVNQTFIGRRLGLAAVAQALTEAGVSLGGDELELMPDAAVNNLNTQSGGQHDVAWLRQDLRQALEEAGYVRGDDFAVLVEAPFLIGITQTQIETVAEAMVDGTQTGRRLGYLRVLQALNDARVFMKRRRRIDLKLDLAVSNLFHLSGETLEKPWVRKDLGTALEILGITYDWATLSEEDKYPPIRERDFVRFFSEASWWPRVIGRLERFKDNGVIHSYGVTGSFSRGQYRLSESKDLDIALVLRANPSRANQLKPLTEYIDAVNADASIPVHITLTAFGPSYRFNSRSGELEYQFVRHPQLVEGYVDRGAYRGDRFVMLRPDQVNPATMWELHKKLVELGPLSADDVSRLLRAEDSAVLAEVAPADDTRLISAIEPIEEVARIVTDIKDLDPLVEAPLREAVRALYRKGIRTYWASANRKDIAEGNPALLMFLYDELSAQNKAVARDVGEVQEDVSTIVRIPMNETTTVADVHRAAMAIVERFAAQPMDRSIAEIVRPGQDEAALSEERRLPGAAFIFGTGNNASVIDAEGDILTEGGALTELGHNIVRRARTGEWVFTGRRTLGDRPALERDDVSFEHSFSGPNIAQRFTHNYYAVDFLQTYVPQLPEEFATHAQMVELVRGNPSGEADRKRRAVGIDIILRAVTAAVSRRDARAISFVNRLGREIGYALAAWLQHYAAEPWTENIVMVSGVGEHFARIEGQSDDSNAFVGGIRAGVILGLSRAREAGGLAELTDERIRVIARGIRRSTMGWERELLAARLTDQEKAALGGDEAAREALSVGISLGGTKIGSGLISADGEILARDEVRWRQRYHESAEGIVEGIVDRITSLIHADNAPRLRKIGIAFAGPVDRANGIAGTPFKAPNLPFDKFNLAGAVRDRLVVKWKQNFGMDAPDILIDIYNDNVAAAIGEQSRGGSLSAVVADKRERESDEAMQASVPKQERSFDTVEAIAAEFPYAEHINLPALAASGVELRQDVDRIPAQTSLENYTLKSRYQLKIFEGGAYRGAVPLWEYGQPGQLVNIPLENFTDARWVLPLHAQYRPQLTENQGLVRTLLWLYLVSRPEWQGEKIVAIGAAPSFRRTLDEMRDVFGDYRTVTEDDYGFPLSTPAYEFTVPVLTPEQQAAVDAYLAKHMPISDDAAMMSQVLVNDENEAVSIRPILSRMADQLKAYTGLLRTGRLKFKLGRPPYMRYHHKKVSVAVDGRDDSHWVVFEAEQDHSVPIKDDYIPDEVRRALFTGLSVMLKVESRTDQKITWGDVMIRGRQGFVPLDVLGSLEGVPTHLLTHLIHAKIRGLLSRDEEARAVVHKALDHPSMDLLAARNIDQEPLLFMEYPNDLPYPDADESLTEEFRFEQPDKEIIYVKFRRLQPDAALTAEEKKGGIDLNPVNMRLNVDGEALPFRVDNVPAPVAPIEGIRPVILHIVPVPNLPLLLGLNDDPRRPLAAGETNPSPDLLSRDPADRRDLMIAALDSSIQ